MTKAILVTNFGQISIKLLTEMAPKTAENFSSLVKSGFYDRTLFHRVIPLFMIQGGDPNTRDNSNMRSWGLGGPGYCIPAEFNSRSHTRGTVSMARSRDPNNAGSQFFILVKDTKRLDSQYTAFGEVIDGMKTVDDISNLSRNLRDIPTKEAKILSASIID